VIGGLFIFPELSNSAGPPAEPGDYAKDLTANSNYENSQLLRVTEQKIKSSKENIFLKYYGEEEKTEIPLLFLKSLTGKKIKPGKDKDTYTFVLEDKRIRAYLEYLLKKKYDDTLDYNLNTEKVSLNIETFFKVCSEVIKDLGGKMNIDMKDVQKELEAQQKSGEFKRLLGGLIEGGISAADKLTHLPVGAVAQTLSVVWKYFTTRLNAGNTKEK
jgi:hypothetical protein